MKEAFFSISDSELGDGSYTDDFLSDELFIKKLQWMDKKHGKIPVTLVINGDGFDFLKVSYKGHYTRYVTKEVSLWKLEQMYKAHKKVFLALRAFASKKKNTVVFTLGNHDLDLAFFEVQERMRELIHPRIVFPGFEYEKGCVRIEHGSQHEMIFYINPDRIFLDMNGKKILNLPWVAYGLFEHQSRLKNLFPFIDTVYPRDTLEKLYPKFHRGITLATAKYFIQSAVVNQIRYFNDITYRLSLRLIWDFIKRLFQGELDVIFEDDLKSYARGRKDLQVIIAGHSHIGKFEKIRHDCWYLNTGAWRDEFVVKADGRVFPKKKYIAEVLVNNNKVQFVKLHDVMMEENPQRFAALRHALATIEPRDLKYLGPPNWAR